jgi:hypothetical protein
LIKQLQTWYLNVYISVQMLSGKLKGMGGFSEKKTIRTSSVDGSEYHLLGYSAAI